MTGSNEFKLNQPPEDGISSVKFSPNTSQFLLLSSWDTSVRLYDVPANSMRLKYQHAGAVLDCAFYVRGPSALVQGAGGSCAQPHPPRGRPCRDRPYPGIGPCRGQVSAGTGPCRGQLLSCSETPALSQGSGWFRFLALGQ
jgi:hypothetical protein